MILFLAPGTTATTTTSYIRAVKDLPYSAVVAPIEYHRPIAADEVRFVRGRTTRRIKATLPSPYIIGRRMWHPEHSVAAYPTREKLMRDCVPVLRREIEAIRAAGANTVQLDEPWLAVLVDPRFREKEGIRDVQHEMDLDEAYLKLKSMCAAADELRAKYG